MSEQQFDPQGTTEQQQAAKNVQDARQRALDDSAKELQARAEQISRQEAAFAQREQAILEREAGLDLSARTSYENIQRRLDKLSGHAAQTERRQSQLFPTAQNLSPLQIIDARIAETTDTKQIAELVKQRGVLAKQMAMETAETRKWIQTKWKIAERYVLTPPLIGAGMWMQLHHFTWPGGLMIGGGLFILVPEFVRLYLRQHKSGDVSSDKPEPKSEAGKIGE